MLNRMMLFNLVSPPKNVGFFCVKKILRKVSENFLSEKRPFSVLGCVSDHLRNMSHPPPPREFSSTTEAWLYLKKKAASVKAQNLREKFDREILQIRSHMQNERIFPTEHKDWYFATLESNGIWEEVFKYVMSPSDIWNASLAFELFRGHLERTGKFMHLPQVFGVLRKQGYLHYNHPWRHSRSINRTVLDLRLVSKSWKEAADEQFLAPVEFFQPDWHLRRSKMNNRMTVWSPVTANFGKTKDVEKAIDALRLTTSCQCLLKVVEINKNGMLTMPGVVGGVSIERLRIEKENFYRKLMELMELHGEHVWALHLTEGYDYVPLVALVTRMPNLRELFVNANSWIIEATEDEEMALFNLFPFPTVPSLTRLVFPESPRHNKFFPAEILQRNSHLKTFSVASMFPGYLGKISEALASIPLECYDVGLASMNQAEFYEDIQTLGQMRWPLKVLNLTRGSGNRTDRGVEIKGSDFFGTLERFNDTLEAINLETMILWDDGENVVVHFPNLKNLEEVAIIL